MNYPSAVGGTHNSGFYLLEEAYNSDFQFLADAQQRLMKNIRDFVGGR